MRALDFNELKKFFKNSYKILDLEYLPHTVISTLPVISDYYPLYAFPLFESESGSNYDSLIHVFTNHFQTGVVYLYQSSLLHGNAPCPHTRRAKP